MELLLASAIGLLTGCGVWLALRPRSFDLVLGLTLLSYAANLFIFAMSRPGVGRVPLIRDASTVPTLATHADPLPQALVLTAIVIGFAMTAVLLVVAMRSYAARGSDEDDADDEPPAGARR